MKISGIRPKIAKAPKISLPQVTKINIRGVHPPLTKHTPMVAKQAKRMMTERQSDPVVKSEAKQLGYTKVVSGHYDKIHGIDKILLKESKDGKLLSAALMEIKSSQKKNPSPSTLMKQTTSAYNRSRLSKAADRNIPYAKSVLGLFDRGKVKQYGASVNVKDKKAILYERVKNGSLQKLTYPKQSPPNTAHKTKMGPYKIQKTFTSTSPATSSNIVKSLSPVAPSVPKSNANTPLTSNSTPKPALSTPSAKSGSSVIPGSTSTGSSTNSKKG